MELTKKDTQIAKGVAVIGMVMLHLFCRLESLPYTPLVYISNIPLVYYVGLFGDFCVPIFCFCSGYAYFLIKENLGSGYNSSVAKKILRFLLNYWIVLILFSFLGIISGNGAEIPGSFKIFLGNFFLYALNYNGAWWFVVTYIFLTLASPLIIAVIKKLHPALIIFFSAVLYLAAYLLRFRYTQDFSNAVFNWMWQQLILIGTSQLAYVVGMVCRKERWISKLRLYIDVNNNSKEKSFLCRKYFRLFMYFLPVFAFIGHCRIQSMIIAPFTAAMVLIALFAIKIPLLLERFFLFMGRHSTNIWLVHMFSI